jgi:hypothetical protein
MNWKSDGVGAAADADHCMARAIKRPSRGFTWIDERGFGG